MHYATSIVSMISSIPVTANSVVWWHVNGLCSTTLIPHDKMFALLWLNDDLFEIRFVVLYCFLYFCLYLGWCVAVSVQYQPCHPQVGKHHIENSHLKHEIHAVFHTMFNCTCSLAPIYAVTNHFCSINWHSTKKRASPLTFMGWFH